MLITLVAGSLMSICSLALHDEPVPPKGAEGHEHAKQGDPARRAGPPGSGEPGTAAPLDWKALEAPLLTHHVQITSRDQFVKAGEAYFSPDGQWIIFQATPVPEKGKEPDPFYAMYVARLERDEAGHVRGITDITRVSKPGSANTCGWFHPTDLTAVIFGSTVVTPQDEGKSGFQVGSRQYKWMFPAEMEVVEARPFVTWGRGRNSVHTPSDTTPIFTRANYDAECSMSKDGRFVLYAHIEDAAKEAAAEGHHNGDANIYIYDTLTKKQIPIVVAPGYDGGPFFSPDGRSICYRSDRKGNDLLQLFVADLKFEKDPNGLEVPVGIEKEYQLTDNQNVNWCPFWHPSGQYMIYATSEVSHGNYEVFAIESDMAKLRAGTPTSQMRKARVTSANGADVLPVFSADGKLVMWTAQRGAMAEGESKPSSQLWIAEVSGSPFEKEPAKPVSP